MKSSAAEDIASNFEGCGPNIYLMHLEAWEDLLGNRRLAMGIYCVVVTRRHEEGAVPHIVKIPNGNDIGSLKY